jgi:hypothetical protein
MLSFPAQTGIFWALMPSAMSPMVYTTLFWLSTVCAVVASVALIWSVRPRRGTGIATRGVGDLVWAVLPTLALFVILALTWPHVRGVGGP